jgi:hypothetical protein
MSTVKSGVFPCYENQFKAGTVGEETPSTSIANCEEFGVAFDNGVDEWNAFENEGWVSRLMTAKSIKISVKAKRTLADPGNDMIAACAHKNGKDAELNFLWTFPDGSIVLFKNAVISVTNPGSGAATTAAPLEFEVMSNGKPVYTPAA